MKRSTAKRREPVALSERQVIDAALVLIQREGTDRFSMRRLAKELGVTPMAVYYYVRSKDEMFELLADAVLSRVERAAPGQGDWHAQIKLTSLNAFRLLCEYPGLSAQIVKQPPTHSAEQMSAYGTSILIAAGFDAAVAARLITTCQAFMFGMIGLQAQIELAKTVKKPTRVATAYLAQLNAYDLVAEGLSALLSGLGAQVPKPARTAKARTRKR